MADFDADPWSLNVLNGVVDLRTGALTEHSESRLLMKQSRLRYDPNARCPEWEKFIDWAHPDDDQLWYLQKVLGYSITGDMGEQTYWTHHGYGNNGKSVTFRVMNAVLGAYAHDLPPKALTARRNDAHPTELADIAGKRLLMVSELAVGARYDDAIIKSITGQEPLTARKMRQDNFTFKPIGKIHFLVNSLPGSDGGNAMERREHLRGGDQLWLWIDDMFEKDEQNTANIDATTLYQSYVNWCGDNGFTRPLTRPIFSRAVRERGFYVTGREKTARRRTTFGGYKFANGVAIPTEIGGK